MRPNIVKSKNAEQLYIIKSIRKDGKATTRIMKKLGTIITSSKSLYRLHQQSLNLTFAPEKIRSAHYGSFYFLFDSLNHLIFKD